MLAAAGLTPEHAQVIAFDRSPKRLGVLKRRMSQLKVDAWIKPQQQDFLASDPADPALQKVRCILLDPSCSGSGMVSRVDHAAADLGAALPEVAPEHSVFSQAAARQRKGGRHGGQKRPRSGKAAARGGHGAPAAAPVTATSDTVAALAAFQLKALLHAISFPAVRRISYSTCSVFRQENEAVVLGALAEANADGLSWRLVPALPWWHRRGDQPEADELPADAHAAAALLGQGAKRQRTEGGEAASVDLAGDVGFVPEHCVCVNPFEGDTSGGFFLAILERVHA